MKMHRTLYYKFIAAYVVFAILSFIAVSTLTSTLTKKHLIAQSADSLYREASLVANSYAKRIYDGDMSPDLGLSQLSAIDAYIGCPIWIIDSSGRVVLYTRDFNDPAKDGTVGEFDPTLAKSYYMTGSFCGNFEEETLSVFAPITASFAVRGYVVIHSSMNSISESVESIMSICYITMSIMIGLSLLILIVFSEVVYIPLSRITTAAEEYAKGNYHYKLETTNTDEMGYLAGTLNYMASEIARTEDNQKKFVANVSHDFRSPLTSIRGYLEAMLDGTIPAELHDKYLKVVLNETERLTKLTNSLLQLNSINTKGMILDIKDFDINDCIRRTIETFEGTCLARQIMVDLILTGETMYVHGDQEKIKQVLYNLIDNAIKFSNDKSVIKIETTDKKDKVFVSVKDSGIGIPKESVGLVFDRFYKSDQSRGKDKKGTGLGLAITKEIIHAHNENINVISTEGVGTEFIFTVSKSRRQED